MDDNFKLYLSFTVAVENKRTVIFLHYCGRKHTQAWVDSPTKHGVVLYRVMFAWVCVPNDSVDSFRRRGTNVWAHRHEHATLKGMVRGIT